MIVTPGYREAGGKWIIRAIFRFIIRESSNKIIICYDLNFYTRNKRILQQIIAGLTTISLVSCGTCARSRESRAGGWAGERLLQSKICRLQMISWTEMAGYLEYFAHTSRMIWDRGTGNNNTATRPNVTNATWCFLAARSLQRISRAIDVRSWSRSREVSSIAG